MAISTGNAQKNVYVPTLASMPTLNTSMAGTAFYIANVGAIWLYTAPSNGTTKPTLTSGTVGTASAVYNSGSGVFFGIKASMTKSDIGLGNVDNTSDATKKTNFTGSIASGNTGFVLGGDVFTALSGKSPTGHNHDDRYFTESEINNNFVALSGKQDIGYKRFPNGVTVKNISATQGTDGWFKVATITISTSYKNSPFVFVVSQRARHATIIIEFVSANNNDPALARFEAYNTTTDAFNAKLYKSATSTWELWIQKSESYDILDVLQYLRPEYNESGITVTWENTQQSTEPDGVAITKFYGVTKEIVSLDQNNDKLVIIDGTDNKVKTSYISQLDSRFVRSANLDGKVINAAVENNAITIGNRDNGSGINGLGGTYKTVRTSLDFNWYSTKWGIGNIRNEGTGSHGFGFMYQDKVAYFLPSHTDSVKTIADKEWTNTQLDGKASSSHTHGQINNDGTITASDQTLDITNDKLLIRDNSNSGSIRTIPVSQLDSRYYTETESDARFLRTILGNSVARGSVHKNQSLSGGDNVFALVSQTNMVNLIAYLNQQTQVVENSTDGSTWNAISGLPNAIYGSADELSNYTDIFNIASGIKHWRVTLTGNLGYKQLTWLAIRRSYVGAGGHPDVFVKFEVGNGTTYTTLFEDINIYNSVEDYTYLRINSRTADTHVRITLHTTSTNVAQTCRVNGIQLLGFYSNQKQIYAGSLIEDGNKRLVTDTEKSTWNGKQNALTTINQIPRFNHQGNATSTNYHKLAVFPIDDAGNYSSVIIRGRVGGWTNDNIAYFEMILTNRSGALDGNSIGASIYGIGKIGNAQSIASIVVYKQANKSAIAYLKLNSYYTYDIEVETFQATIDYSATSVTPTGTLIWESVNEKTITVQDGALRVYGSNDDKINLYGSSNPYIRFHEGTTPRAYIQFNGTNDVLRLENQQVGNRVDIGTNLVFHQGGVDKNVILSDDSRLTDARTPTSHGHNTADIYDYNQDDTLENVLYNYDLAIYNRIPKDTVSTKTANYTLLYGDWWNTITFNSSSSLTLTIPANASIPFPIGTEVTVIRQGSGDVTIAINSDTLLSEGSKKKINAQYQGVILKKIATTTWVIIGALKT